MLRVPLNATVWIGDDVTLSFTRDLSSDSDDIAFAMTLKRTTAAPFSTGRRPDKGARGYASYPVVREQDTTRVQPGDRFWLGSDIAWIILSASTASIDLAVFAPTELTLRSDDPRTIINPESEFERGLRRVLFGEENEATHKPANAIDLYIDAGDATKKQVQDVLGCLSDLHKAAGGTGLTFTPDGQAMVVRGARR